MRYILIILMMMACMQVSAQAIIPVGGTTGNDTAQIANNLKTLHAMTFKYYKTKDTMTAVVIDSNGNVYLRDFATTNSVIDTLHNWLGGQTNALPVYTSEYTMEGSNIGDSMANGHAYSNDTFYFHNRVILGNTPAAAYADSPLAKGVNTGTIRTIPPPSGVAPIYITYPQNRDSLDTTSADGAAMKPWVINKLTALSGDIASVSPSGVVTFTTTGVTAGTYGNTSQMISVTVDAKGRVTGITTYTMVPTFISSVTVTSPLTITGTTIPTLGIGTTGTAGTYGNANTFVGLTTDNWGRASSVSTYTIPIQAVNGSGNIIASTSSNTVSISLNASVTPTASVIPQYDGNANLFSNNEINSLLNLTGSTVYTLTAASPRYIYAANGSSSIFTLPATNALSLGEQFTVFNFGGATIQMNISGGTSLFTIPASYSVSATFMVISTSSVSATSNWAIMYNAGYTGGNISVGSATSTLTSSLYNSVFANGMSFKTGLSGNSTSTDFNFTYNSGLGAITNTSGSHSLLASSGDFAATTGSGNYYEVNPAPVITQSTSCTGEVAIYKSSPLVASCNSKFMLMDLGCNNVSKFATDSAGNNYITSNFTTVSGSTSGTAIFNEPDRGGGKKTVQCYSNSLNGTAAYTFPVAFTYAPIQVAASSGISATISTTSVTVTGTGTSGWIIFEGY